MSTIPLRPPSSCFAVGDLITLILETTSDSKIPNAKPPLKFGVASVCPLTRVREKRFGKPRTAIWPSRRSPPGPDVSSCTPVTRDRESARFRSGNLPIPSAAIPSMIESALRLFARASSSERLTPTVTISSIGSSSAACAAADSWAIVGSDTHDAAMPQRSACASNLSIFLVPMKEMFL